MKQAPRSTRKSKNDRSAINHQMPKASQVKWNETNGINRITLTETQEVFRQKILSNDLVFCVAPAGTGKTLAAFYTAVQEYLNDPSMKIIYVRTPVEAGMDKIGALPDGLNAKIEPHFASAKALLELLLTKGKVENDLDHRILFKVPNFCLGATFDNAIVIIDEAQQLPPLILKLLLERLGKYSKAVVLGDNTQLYTDSKGRNALLDAIPRFFDQNLMGKYPEVCYHGFSVDDVQRSDIVKTVIRAYS